MSASLDPSIIQKLHDIVEKQERLKVLESVVLEIRRQCMKELDEIQKKYEETENADEKQRLVQLGKECFSEFEKKLQQVEIQL